MTTCTRCGEPMNADEDARNACTEPYQIPDPMCFLCEPEEGHAYYAAHREAEATAAALRIALYTLQRLQNTEPNTESPNQ